MTTMPTSKPPAPAPHRPPAQGQGVVVVDPIKLIKKHKWTLGASALVGVAVGLAAHYTLMAVYPIYTAEIVYQCYAQDQDPGTTVAAPGFREELDKFMATQAQIMMSDGVIDGTVNDPRLESNASGWRSAFVSSRGFDSVRAAKRLDRRLSAGILGDSQLIRLSFWDTDKDDAVAIVKIVGDVYERARKAVVNKDQASRRDALSRSILDVEKKVDRLQRDRANLIQESSLDSLDEQVNFVTQTVRVLQEKMVDAAADREIYLSRLERMKAEEQSPTGRVYEDNIRLLAERDEVVMNMRQQVNLIDAELKAMTVRGIGPNHVSYKRLASQLEGQRRTYDALFEQTLAKIYDGQRSEMQMGISSTEAQMLDLAARREEMQKKATELTNIRAKVLDIKDEINHLQEVKTKTQDELNNLQALLDLDSVYRVASLRDAQTPREVTFPKMYIMIPAGIFLVVGLVGGVVLLFEVLDQRVKSPADIAMIPRARVVGLIPHASEDPANPQRVETVFRDHAGGVLAESFRGIRGTLGKRLQQGGHKSLLVFSGMPGSGATSVTINLAYAFAAAEHRVLIIDANFRRSGVARTLGLQESPGLADVLAGVGKLPACVQKTDNALVEVLAVGSAQHRKVERLGTDAMKDLIRDAGSTYDLILVDCAPAGVAGDALALANRCDATILVVRAMNETRGMVARLTNDLSECHCGFLGVVVNGARSAAGGYLKGNIMATHQYQAAKD